MIGIPTIPGVLLKLAPYAAAGAACVALATFAPIVGFNARLHHVQHQRDTYRASAVQWHAKADGWSASFKASEAARKTDQAAAVKSVEAETASCNVRVAEARKSAKAIKRITDAPVKLDAANCPVRTVVDAGSLRDALQPAHR